MPVGWWENYTTRLRAGVTDAALSVIEKDCRYVVDKGVLGAGAPGGPGWPTSRVRTGLVIGAVQSGKTASMFGVTAQALDSGVDMVLILAGTRLALWRQTVERFVRQVDFEGSAFRLKKRRLLFPDPGFMLSSSGGLPPSDLYSLVPSDVERAIDNNRPIVAFAMKHPDHLRAFSRQLRETLFPLLEARDKPFHLVVLDDEADDGSILDAVAEQGIDPVMGQVKQTPRSIAGIWQHLTESETASKHLYATYVAYTATPQANLLQENHNPLAPRHFVACLRTPFDDGEISPRQTTFREPSGLQRYYTGGAVFYERGENANLCRTTPDDPEEALRSAVRAYLVAGAIRNARAAGLGTRDARAATFESLDDLKAAVHGPHTMLIHPSGLVSDHFATATDLLAWAGATDEATARKMLEEDDTFLPASLGDDVLQNESQWQEWHVAYTEAAGAIKSEFDLVATPQVPAWDTVRDLLIEQVIPAVRLAIINSDERADDRPEFDPTQSEGAWRAPRDLATIFISGNVMSRGLTLEGLTTTLFLRRSNSPFADTQMQMQRWFGYRGRDLELCKVFLPSEQLSLFRQYHSTDEAMRRMVIAAMNDASSDRAPLPTVLHGRDFLATGKIAKLSQVPLSPGPLPMIALTNDGCTDDPNLGLLTKTFEGASDDVIVQDRLRGRVLAQQLDLKQVADLLDNLTYETYRPGRIHATAEHWEKLQASLEFDSSDPLLPLYRAPEPPDGATHDAPLAPCPYGIAAYLRLWSALLSRRAPGFVATDDPDLLWSMTDLQVKNAHQPRFYVGIRYGGAPPVTTGPLGQLPFSIRPMNRSIDDDRFMRGSWGSRNESTSPNGYLGDELFDYHVSGRTPPYKAVGDTDRWRPPGCDGLVLFHVLEGTAGPTLAVGLAIPRGGPDQIPALLNT